MGKVRAMIVLDAFVLYTLAGKLLIKTLPFWFFPDFRETSTRRLFLGTICELRLSLILAFAQVVIKR